MALGSMAEWFLVAALCYVVALLVFVGIGVVKDRKEAPAFQVIRYWLGCLLKNGYDGEAVIFRDTAKSRFIRFEKYTDAAGSTGIRLTFPTKGWGEPLLPKLRQHAERKGLVLEGPDGTGPGYAQIPFGSDLDGAFALCRTIWTEYFGFDEQSDFLGQPFELSTVDELLGNGARPSEDERKKRYLRHVNARLKHVGLGALQATSLQSFYVGVGFLILLGGLGFAIALVGLPVAVLSALGDPPDWRIEFWDIGLQGSTTGLVLFCLYLLAGALIYRLLRISLIDRQSGSHFEWAFHAPKRFVFACIPVAVVLIWLQI